MTTLASQNTHNQWQTSHKGYRIRPITPADNDAIKTIIISTLEEYGAVGKGYASGDAETQAMSNYYDGMASQYWVIENKATGIVVGGGGYSRLKGTEADDAICELQKVYFLPETRGKGLGQLLIRQCMAAAKGAGYQTMYIETIPAMERAAQLYQRLGFAYLATHWGATGHHNRCTLRLAKPLTVTEEDTLAAPAKVGATKP